MTPTSPAHDRAPPTIDMAGRVARFAELRFSRHGHLDTYLPGHEREIAAVIGPGVMEDPNHRPAIVAADGFNVTYARVEPGNGNALHDHKTVEVFIPLSGRWSFRWGEAGEHEVVLDAWDTISIPPGVNRCYRNVGGETACLLAIIGGSDPGEVVWARSVLEAAARRGVTLDERGQVRVRQAAKG